MCGELRPEQTGAQVVLLGWVNRRRDLGNVIFIDIRDRSGMTQLVFDKSEIQQCMRRPARCAQSM